MLLRRTGARAWVSGTALLATGLGLALVGPLPSAQALSQDAVPGYQTNGRVTSIVTYKNTVYIAGAFTSVRPAGAPAGTGEVARNHLAAFRVDTGALRAWSPDANGTVSALAMSTDRKTLYVGGVFTRLNGKKRHDFGAVSRKNGRTKRFRADTNAQVLAIATTKSRVYLGGSFTKIKSKQRKHVGAVDLKGRVVLKWKPRASGDVRALAISRDKSRVYVGGDFSAINSHRHAHLAAIGVKGGKVLRWRGKLSYSVWDIVVNKKSVYVGGNGIGGRVTSYSPKGKRHWTIQVDGGVQALAYNNGKVIVGGHFYNLCEGVSGGTTPGFDCPVVQAHRPHLLALGYKTGHLNSWNPVANSPLGVFALSNSMAGVYAGGDFTRISGADQQGLAHFS